MLFTRFLLFFIFAALFTQLAISQRVGGGLIDTLQEQKKIKVNYPITRGETSVPTSHSLRVFAPPVQNQGSTPSCISWATAYAGMTIVKRIEQGSLKVSPFSAMNLYNRVRPYDNLNQCDAGSLFESNVILVNNKGVTYDGNYPKYCENLSPTMAYANKLFRYEDLNISAWNIKYAIARNRPVMIGMKMYSGNYWATMSYHETGIWNGTHTGDISWNHGMLVIGYDDRIAGGAFLVMNSWGTDFGKDGYFWLKYNNVRNEIICAYALIPKIDRSAMVIGGAIRGENNTQSIPELNSFESFRSATMIDTLPMQEKIILPLQNRCAKPINVAFGFVDASGKHSKGWYTVQANADASVSFNSFDSIYIYAENKTEGWKSLIDNSQSIAFTVDSLNSFHLKDNETQARLEFTPLGLNSSLNSFIVMTCQQMANPVIKVSQKLSSDTTDTWSRNKNWNGVDLLFDPIKNERISPNKQNYFNVFVTDGKRKPSKKLVASDELKLLQLYKFATKQNAIEFIILSGN
jgi:hypothetical protein